MRTLLISPDEAFNRELTVVLEAYPEIDMAGVLPAYPSVEDFLRIVRARKPDFLFISTSDLERFESLAAAVDDSVSGVPVIGLSRDANLMELVPRMMHLGVRELLTAPLSPQKLAEVIASTKALLSKRPAPIIRQGDLYTFLPAKAGVGTSTIAVSTSCALADELNLRTVLLDCDLAAGAVKFLLRLGNSSSVVDMLGRAEGLDEDLWSQMVGRSGSLHVLHAGDLAPPASLNLASLDQILALARSQYDTICADLGSSIDPFSLHLMRESRRILMVVTPELAPLHMAAQRIRHLKELGIGDKVSLLLNRKNGTRTGLSAVEVVQLAGLPITQEFCNDYGSVQSAILGATHISYKSGLGQSVLSLARSLAPTGTISQTAPHEEHRRFLEFFHVPTNRDHDMVWQG